MYSLHIRNIHKGANMEFPATKKPTRQRSLTLPDELWDALEADAKAVNPIKPSVNQRAEYWLYYAIQCGAHEEFASKVAAQYAEMSSRAHLDHEVISSYAQVERLMDQVTYLDDNVRNLIEVVKRLSVTVMESKEGEVKV